MTNAAFAFMCAGVLALAGVCAVSSDWGPLIASGTALAVGFAAYAKGW